MKPKYPILKAGPIGVFDSGYGGLTILKNLVKKLPHYDYCYLGDNVRSPYGDKSFDMVTQYTQQCVETLFLKGCNLVLLACNTASAKALRSIQQNYLPIAAPHRRVLGVIRPTAEMVGEYSKSGAVGILGTYGTVRSESYPIEIHKFFPALKVYQQACPMWVTLVENNAFDSSHSDTIVKENLDDLFIQSSEIDTIVLGCTHYPLLIDKIKRHLPPDVNLISQGEIVATSFDDYLKRHPEMESVCSKEANTTFYTSGDSDKFDTMASLFFGKSVKSNTIDIGC